MKGFHKLFLLILLTIQGCGGGGSSSNCSDCDTGDSTSPTTQKEITFNGRVVDGPLAGARVFIDLNGNGVENANEPAVTTNEDGFFSITGPDKVNAKIIALGGIDTATGVELSDFALSIQTPSDPAALVSVNPFTTLLSQVTTEEYQILIDALGIDTDAASVSTEDHWALAQAGNTNAMAIQRINMQIGLLMQSGNNLFNGATSNSERAGIAVAQAMSELAKTTSIDLKETKSVSAILQRASSLLAPNNPMPSDILEAVAEPIASFAQVIASKDFNPTGNTAAQVTRISQQSLQTSIVDLVTGNINLEGFKQAASINELLSAVDLSLEQATLDTDGDKIPNIIDPDDDNDGVRDEDDIAPLNSKPTIELTLVVHDNEVTIKWDANDPEENAAVSLYYDIDNAGYDGKKINNTAFFEDTDSSYQWQTSWQASQLKSGNYYIYASISDGINAPVFAYADQKITISRASTINGFPIEVVYQGAPYYFKPTVDTNEKLSFSATNLPGWMDIDQTSGEITGTPDNDDVGPHNDIVISVTDILGNSASLPEFDINVMNINDRPQAYSQRIRIDENESIIFTLMGSDIDNDQLEFIIVEYPQHGLLQLDGDMATYASTSDTATEDRFTYKVSDSLLDSEIVQVAIDIRAINDVPTAQSKTVVAQEQRAQSISLVVADNDNDIEDLTISIDALPQHGTLKQDDMPIITAGTSVPASTVLTYTSDPGAESDQFMFKAHDETDSSELATVDISVSTNTDKPHISGLSDSRDFLDMHEDSELVLSVDDFAISSTQTDQSGFSLHIESPDEQANYSVAGNTIVPNADFHGDFVVLVTVFDGELYSVPFDFKTIVLPQPDAPEISDQIFDSISENQTTIGQVHAEDPDGDNLLFGLVTGSDILNITTGGVLSFKEDKAPDFEAQPIYTTQVLVKDAVAGGLSDTATVTIKISNINEPPIADPIDLEVRQQVSTPIDLLGSDPENAPITYLITSLPTKGKLSDDGVILNAYPHAVNGELLYMADPLEPGLLKSTDQFTYQAVEILSQSNNALSSEDATVSIQIKPPIPSATEIVLAIPKHLPVELALTNTNNDPDERYEITEKPTVGTLKDIQSNGVAVDINQEQLPYLLKGELVYSRSSALNEHDVITYRVLGSEQTAEVKLYDIYNHGKITYVPDPDNASDQNAPNTNNAPLITWHDSVTETVYLGSSYWNNMPRMADVDIDFCDNNNNTERSSKNLPPNNDCMITALQQLKELSTDPAKRLYTFRSNPYNPSQSTILGRFVFDTPIVELNASQDCSSSFSCFVDLTWTWADGGDSNLDNLNLYYKSEDSEEILITSVNRATQELSYRWQDNIPQSGTYTIYAKVCSDIDPDDCYFKSQPTVINIGFVFTSPTAVEGSLVVEDHFNITWLSNDTVSQAQVKLYYDTDDSGYDGILIQSSLDLTGNHNWDMSLLESGTYYIYAEISDGNSTKYTYAPGALILNRAPSILFNSPVNASGESANNSFVIQWTAEDPDDQAAITLWYDTDNLDYNGIQIQTQDQLDINDSSYPWDISKLQRGDYFIYAIIDDNINEPLKTYAPGKIVINNVPTANSINVIAYQEISKKITLQGTSSYDGVLSYQIASLPEYGVLQDDNGPITSVEHIVIGELTYTSISTTATSDQFTYTAFDGETSSAASVNITIQVLEVDNPPILEPIGDINFDEDSFGTITLEVDEFDGDSFSLDVTSQAGNSSNFTITADNNQFAFKSTDNWSGEETFTATVTDQTEAAKSTSQSFKVIVNPVDDAPLLKPIGDITIDEDGLGIITPEVDEYDGHSLSYDVTSQAGNSSNFIVSVENNKLILKPNDNWSGEETFTATVSDQTEAAKSTSQSFMVSVESVDDAPTLEPIDDITIDENNSKSIILRANDVDGDAISFSVISQAQNSKITVTSGKLWFPNLVTFKPDDNWYGEEEFTATVTANGKSASQDFKVIVNIVDNAPDLKPIDDITINEDELGTITLEIDEYDGDSFSYEVTSQAGNSSNFTITADNNQFVFKPTDNWSGEESFTATVTDLTEAAKSTSQSFKVIVTSINDTPRIELNSPSNVNGELIDSELTIMWEASDPDDNAKISLYYSENNSAFQGTKINVQDELFEDEHTNYTWNIPTSLESGDYYIYAEINDGANDPVTAFAPGKIVINGAPSIAITNLDNDIFVENQYIINWSASDPENDLAEIGLYYSFSDTGNCEEGSLIELVTNESSSFTWNTESIGTGDYHICATIEDDWHKAVSAYSVGKIKVRHTEVAFDSTATTPSGEQYIQLYKGMLLNASVTINTGSTDNALLDGSLSFSLLDSTGTDQLRELQFKSGSDSQSYHIKLSPNGLTAESVYKFKLEAETINNFPVTHEIDVRITNPSLNNGSALIGTNGSLVNLNIEDQNTQQLQIHSKDSGDNTTICSDLYGDIFLDNTDCEASFFETGSKTLADVKGLSLINDNGYLSEVGRSTPPHYQNHQLVSFKEKLWLLTRDQIWYSNDGEVWVKAVERAPFNRQNHQVVVYNDGSGEKMWLIGGYDLNYSPNPNDSSNDKYTAALRNDIWSSSDGITWTEVPVGSNHFSPREHHQVVVYNDGSGEKLWLIGGSINMTSGSNEVWSSTDGSNWTNIDALNMLSGISQHQVVAYNDGTGEKIWLVGGSSSVEIWTFDGSEWQQKPTPANKPWINGHQMLVFNNKIWIIGGSCYHNPASSVPEECEGSIVAWHGDGTFSGWQSVISEDDSIRYRSNHQVALFDGKLWLSGGFHGNHWTDLRYSDDGENWIKAGTSSFSPRREHQAVVFNSDGNEQLWLIGGTTTHINSGPSNDASGNLDLNNDIWRSADGISWTNVTPTTTHSSGEIFSPRKGHQLTSFNVDTETPYCTGNSLWLIGGKQTFNRESAYYRFGYMNDIWCSEDGESWTKIIQDPTASMFSDRSDHQVVTFKGKLWLIGGVRVKLSFPFRAEYLNDIWQSENGAYWNQVTVNGGHFSGRMGHQLVVFDDRLWLIGGYSDDNQGTRTYFNDVWSSTDGSTWIKETANAAFEPRANHQVIAFDNKLWLTGGYGSSADDNCHINGLSENCYKNGLWTSSDGKNWTKVSNDDMANHYVTLRTGHQMLKFGQGQNQKIMVIGGNYGDNIKDDIWVSNQDGADWRKSEELRVASPSPAANN